MDRRLHDVSPVDESAGFSAPVWVPYVYQEKGVDRLCNTEAALFFPPGLGKTSCSLEAFRRLKEKGLAKRMLIMAPLMVCRTTWMTEPMKWRQFQHFKVGLAHGPRKAEVLADPSYDIVVINYDAIPWLVDELGLKQTMYDVLLCDEITRLKRTSSKRFKALKPLLPSFKFRWGLTGTPAANGYIDLFGQIYVLDLGKRLGRFITHFRMKYFHQKAWDAYRFYITDEKAKELTAQIEDLALYVAPEDWLSLPPLLHHTIDVPFPKPLRAKYEFLQEEFILKLDETVVTAANAGVLTSKLRQFTGGAIYASDQPGVYETIHAEKLEALENLVEEMNGQPLMVAYQFDHERIRIEEMLKKRGTKCMSLKGGMTTAQATHVMDTWNAGEAEVLLVQPATAALGLNLQFGGDTICWFTLTYNLEEFIQLNKRLHRQGQTNTVRVFMLALEGTIDQYVAKVLSDKEATQDDLFNSLKLEL